MSRPVVHHLDCGTMCSRGSIALGITAKDPGHLVCHCLLIETSDGLVLVDTGYGTGDISNPGRMGATRFMLGAVLDPAQTAAARVEALGFRPADVRHVVLTHLDLDHAGGLGDFPEATVHVHATELAAARGRKGTTRLRYRPAQWAHGPRWAEHREGAGDAWHGFPRARLLDGLDVEIALIPLHGHTEGHSGVAVNAGQGWLLHAGDAYLQSGEVATPPRQSRGLKAYQAFNSVDEAARRANLARLAELARDDAAGVRVFCSHDASEHARLA